MTHPPDAHEGKLVEEIIASEFVTLDGVMEHREVSGHPKCGWVGDFMSPESFARSSTRCS